MNEALNSDILWSIRSESVEHINVACVSDTSTVEGEGPNNKRYAIGNAVPGTMVMLAVVASEDGAREQYEVL